MDKNTGYSLAFSNYMCRHIIAVDDEKPLIDKMAQIMCLHPSNQNNFPKLLFTRTFPFSDKCSQIIYDSYKNNVKTLPSKDWKETDFNLLKICTHHDVPDVVCRVPEKRDASCDPVILSFVYYLIYNGLLEKGALPLHGGMIEFDNMGIILAGPGGSGKSTCCGRAPDPWNSICDDEVMVIPQDKSDYKVHPVPTWSDYFFDRDSRGTWDVQKSFSCTALFFLEKAEVDEAVPIGQGRAAVRIYQSAMESFSRYFPYIAENEQKEISKKVFESSCELSNKSPCFKLRTSRSGSFWKNIEYEINKLNQSDVVNL